MLLLAVGSVDTQCLFLGALWLHQDVPPTAIQLALNLPRGSNPILGVSDQRAGVDQTKSERTRVVQVCAVLAPPGV